MTEQTVIDLSVKAIWVGMKIGAPALLAILLTGLVVGIFQAATQINEQTLSFIPKILVMTIALMACGPWIAETISGFTLELFQQIPTMIHGR